MRARRAIAISAAVLWLLGVEVLPNLHLATHGDDHTHAVDGTIIVARDAAEYARIAHALAHEHGDEHDHATKPKPKPNTQLALDAAPSGHAATGIAHHAVALHQPPPPVTAPAAVPSAEAWCFAEPRDHDLSGQPTRPTARGPPVA